MLYFSVQTSSTIGYGHISPHGDIAKLVDTMESFFGLLGVALMTGIVFARFSRPEPTGVPLLLSGALSANLRYSWDEEGMVERAVLPPLRL